MQSLLPHVPAIALVLLLVVPLAMSAAAAEYKLGPDSQPQNVPHGVVTKHEIISAKAYPGVRHNYWVYVPAQYDGKTPAAVMVFQDGGGFQKADGDFRVPVVFDNLIAKKEMPVTIAIMIDPGWMPAVDPKTQLPRIQRSYQYDSPTDTYARFLIEEVLPEVGRTYKLTADPNLRAVCGNSSGGICAFTVAWERPDAFRRVLSNIGSFTDLRGGNRYPDLLRKMEPKPLRIFLQSGTDDMNVFGGSWWVANQDMAASLKWAGYDYQFVSGTGGHNGQHAGSIFPDALRWLWREYDKPIVPTTHLPGNSVMDIIIPGEGWQAVGEGRSFGGITADAEGNIFFSDAPKNRIHRIGTDGKLSVAVENAGDACDLKIGPDGRLYACQNTMGRVVAFDLKSGKEEVIAADLASHARLVVAHGGGVYVSSPDGKVWSISPTREKKLLTDRIELPGGIGLTPDQGQLVVAESFGVNIHLFQIQADGLPVHGQPFFTSQTAAGYGDAGNAGLCVDADGRLYVATRLGIQVFDQHGRVMAIISKPANSALTGVTFGGKGFDTLFVTCGDKVYQRKTKAKGVHGFQPPVKAGPDKLG